MSAIRRGIMAACCGPSEMEDDNHAVRQFFRFPSDFVGFAGHFPNESILPAVVQIGMGIYLAEVLHRSKSRGKLVLVAVQRAKFMQKLAPEQTIIAHCRRRKGDKNTFDVVLTVNEAPASSFTLAFTSTRAGQQDA
jgi:3-hydroxyacyl-[acyl-carrier-protein] dehydratase